jgi:hypothetical protein
VIAIHPLSGARGPAYGRSRVQCAPKHFIRFFNDQASSLLVGATLRRLPPGDRSSRRPCCATAITGDS